MSRSELSSDVKLWFVTLDYRWRGSHHSIYVHRPTKPFSIADFPSFSIMASTTDILLRKPKNVAIETNPQHDLNVVETSVPEPGPEECLVHVRATGICGSDVSLIYNKLAVLVLSVPAGPFLEARQHW